MFHMAAYALKGNLIVQKGTGTYGGALMAPARDVPARKMIREQLAAFGSNLKARRLERGWTLEELAARSGLSKPFLSRLESGHRQASIAAVLTLSQVFGVSLAAMFEPEQAAEPCLIVRKADAIAHEANGLVYSPLSHTGQTFNLRPIRVKVSRYRQGSEHYQHEGEEWLYVLSGQLTLSLAGRTYELESGDAAHFDSRLPHRIMARGGTDPEVLLVASPLPLDKRGAEKPLEARRAIDLQPEPRKQVVDLA